MQAENTYTNADLQPYGTGLCDVMAIALHRLTGLPFGLWGASFLDDQGDEGDIAYEYAHAVVVADQANLITLDAWGPCEGVPDNLYFSVADPRTAQLLMVSEQDVRCAFTSMEIDEQAIEQAMNMVAQAPWIGPHLKRAQHQSMSYLRMRG